MLNHLWYLNSEKITFSFFDDTLEKKIKTTMAKKLTSQEENDEKDSNNSDVKGTLSRKQVDEILNKELDFFVSPQTLHFFKRFHIDT